MSSFNGAVSDPYWFDPMQLLLDAVGASDERYVFWSGAVGNTLGKTLVNMTNICIQPAFTYPDMNQVNIDALGLKEMFRLWMFEYLQSLYRTP